MAAWRGMSKSMQELRIQFCQWGPASEGLRAFVKGNYASMKQANPQLPILVRECSGANARLIARYDFGKEKAVVVDGLDEAGIAKHLLTLSKSK
mmetsp:Transcript_6728/g.7503  ORF Transcript_6728/g.7503 Transcript_6728/m.7503 type:complete len:94 (+) Transcript_6728:31-312(+)|eukprot:CAMPEP_0205821820 /NCGR_PEP_ID=MMETSP0206-20130828/9704_1 /ASSEMBLY_ACC=CAM_ASM_000279 /TAXON_ID=36767 /ORGANISM="Euplotes focardii, Strain TN1" /LENGTH=93 /DNA_ID=CAMNT_0053117595 /DNA_START=31 /DNA_END=312 /DNA_ORIENTATION=+